MVFSDFSSNLFKFNFLRLFIITPTYRSLQFCKFKSWPSSISFKGEITRVYKSSCEGLTLSEALNVRCDSYTTVPPLPSSQSVQGVESCFCICPRLHDGYFLSLQVRTVVSSPLFLFRFPGLPNSDLLDSEPSQKQEKMSTD